METLKTTATATTTQTGDNSKATFWPEEARRNALGALVPERRLLNDARRGMLVVTRLRCYKMFWAAFQAVHFAC